ncbi:MAG: lysozyme, partial [Sphingobacteriales bacterium]
MMTLSKHGLAIVKNFEGLRLNAYKDIAGVWTIGYGSTRHANGKAVKSGEKLINEVKAEKLLLVTLSNFVSAVNNGTKVTV